jgi:hypothetical protein
VPGGSAGAEEPVSSCSVHGDRRREPAAAFAFGTTESTAMLGTSLMVLPTDDQTTTKPLYQRAQIRFRTGRLGAGDHRAI